MIAALIVIATGLPVYYYWEKKYGRKREQDNNPHIVA
jgi:fructoselysine transporter